MSNEFSYEFIITPAVWRWAELAQFKFAQRTAGLMVSFSVTRRNSTGLGHSHSRVAIRYEVGSTPNIHLKANWFVEYSYEHFVLYCQLIQRPNATRLQTVSGIASLSTS